MTAFSSDSGVVSWGRVLRAPHRVAHAAFRDELPALLSAARKIPGGALASGLRRSYGDSGLNAGGALIDVTGLDRLIAFDPTSGVLTAEAGISLADVLAFAVPKGWFLPVTPGTQNVTLGGAVANDVHGKNHTGAGTIGRHVRELGLLRSDGTAHRLTPQDNSQLFAATIGGLGLTGIITDVSLALKPIGSALLDVETIPFDRLADFFRLTRESLPTHEHTVAWIDCLATGDGLGRGRFTRANHAADGPLKVAGRRRPGLPMDLPGFTLNRLSIGAFNSLYYLLGRMRGGSATVPYDGVFYPLDAVANWNRMYGRRGMYQFQSVVPPGAAEAATAEMLAAIAKAGEGSFLIVLKTFGPLASPGLLSFPMEGTTLALDFPNKGNSTLKLMARLDDIVRGAGGRLYPAKDGRLPRDLFLGRLPGAAAFAEHVDPAFSSSFWRRMEGSLNG